MNILVLGGSRFVGRAIVDALVDRHDVTVLNRGTRSFSDERVRQLVADRTDPAQLGAVLGGQVYDAVVDVSGTEPLHVKNVLPALAWQGGSPYVYVSSAAVYDRTRATTPFRESDPDGGDGIWGDYGYNKASCERLLRTALGDRLIVLRPPYIYGPRNTEPREQFLWARMLAGEPVLVPGDGQTLVQFCYVEELAHIAMVACEGLLVPGIYNVAERRPYTFDQYLAVLADVAGVTPRLTYVHDDTIEAREYFPFREAALTLDPSALDAAGYPHRVGLPAGLATTYTWFLRRGLIVGEPT